ncbi:MAG: LamG-like jellyroll fold domain-containing protein, partial [Gaiellaceae bacterium]
MSFFSRLGALRSSHASNGSGRARRAAFVLALTAGSVAVALVALFSGGAEATGGCASTSAYSQAVMQISGLVGFWRLGDASGTAACDGTGVNPGTYQGGFTLGQSGAIAGDSDKATSFNGTTGDVSVPSSTSLNAGDTFSIEAWVKRGSTGGTTNQVIASKQGTSWMLAFSTANALILQVNGTTVNTSSSTVADTTSWHHVVATKSGTSVHLYIDGKDVTGSKTTNKTVSNNTSALTIGASGTASWFKGTLDEVAAYNSVLSAAQVTDHYLLGLASCSTSGSTYAQTVGGTSGLLGYWRLGERSGATACDSSGQNPGSYLGGFTLAQPGAINGDSDTGTTFNGTTGWVSVPAMSSLNTGDTFTFEGWVKRGTTGGTSNQVIASKQGSAWTLLFNTANKLVLQSGATTIATSTGSVADTTSWHHVAVTKSGSSVHLFVDGTDVTGAVTNVTLANSTSPLAFGQSGGSANWLNGTLDDVALYNAALTATQIGSHYTLGASPANTAAPSISGTATDGQTLTASNGTWVAAGSYAYQWRSCDSSGANCADISGATGQTYAIGHGDVGKTIRVVVTASNSAGSTSATSAQTAAVGAVAPANTSPPTISGNTVDGQTLTASNGTWSGTPGTYTYQWQSCDTAGPNCSNIGGATSQTYTLGPSDVGNTIRVAITSANSAGSASATSTQTSAVAAQPPANTAAPTISGTATDGQTLTASPGTWTGNPTYAYQWQDCGTAGNNCSDIPNATGQTYTLASSDVGHTIRVNVTGTNSGGSVTAGSQPTAVVQGVPPSNTAAPSITGTAQDGQTLTASPGSWNGSAATYAYQWQSCDSSGANCANVSGATGQTYVLRSGDVGTTLRVLVTATNSGGSASATSAQTAVVQAVAPSNVSPPTVSGRAVPGQTLSATAGSWNGTLPTYSYQWQRCNSSGANCSNISGATATSYQLQDGDLGTTVRAAVTATNSAGSASASSAQTAVVVNACTDTWTGSAGDSFWSTAGNWSTGAVPTANDQVCVNSTGTVKVNSGNASVWTVQDAQGTLSVINGSTLQPTDASGTSTVQALSLGSGNVSGAGALNVTGTLTWTSGTMSGSGSTTLAAGGTATIDPGANNGVTLSGRTLNNAGTVNEPSGELMGQNGAAINNSGNWTVNGEGSAGGYYYAGLAYTGTGATPTFENTGTLHKTIGTGSTNVMFGFDNAGTVDDQTGQLNFQDGGISGRTAGGSWSASGAGSSIKFSSGTYTLGSNVPMTGLIIWANGVTVNAASIQGPAATLNGQGGTLSLTDTSTASNVQGLTISGGTLSGAGTLNVSSTLTWTSGTMAGTGVTALGAGVTGTIDPGANNGVTLNGRTLNNAGTVNQPTGELMGQNGGAINNSGSWTVNGEGSSGGYYYAGLAYTGTGAKPTFENTGTLHKTAGTGSTYVQFAFDNAGAVDVQTGQLALWNGGISGRTAGGSWSASGAGSVQFMSGTFSLGSNVPMAGSINWANGVTVTAASIQGPTASLTGQGGTLSVTDTSTASNVQSLTISGGVLSGAGTLNVSSSLTWTSGTMSGSGTTVLGAGCTSTVTAGSYEVYLDGRTLRNQGNFTEVSGEIAAKNGAYVDNSGTMTINGEGGGYNYEGGIFWDFSTGATPQFRNTGTLQKTAGADRSWIDAAIDNEGHVISQSGSLQFWAGSMAGTMGAGSWAGNGTGSVGFYSGTFNLGSGVPMSGSIVWANGVTVNASSVQGLTATLNGQGGTLSVTDTLLQSNVQSLNLTGGTLSGAGTLNVSSSMSWTGGAMTGTGVTALGAGATGTVDAGNYNVTLDTRTFRNAGTFTDNSGEIGAKNGAYFDNSGTFTVNGEGGGYNHEGGIFWDFQTGATPTFRNTGTVQKTAGTDRSWVDAAFDNEGQVIGRTGTLQFWEGSLSGSMGGGSWTGTGAGTVSFNNGTFVLASGTQLSGAVLLTNGVNVLAPGIQVPSGTLTLQQGTLVLTDSSVTSPIANLALTGGTLAGTGTAKVSGTLNWTGGRMAGTGTTILTPGSTTTIDTGTGQYFVDLDQRTLLAQGNVTETEGELAGKDGAYIDNTGTFTVNGEGAGFNYEGGVGWDNPYGSGGAPPVFHSCGTLQKTAGTGTTYIGTIWVGCGPVVAHTGTIKFDGPGSSPTLGGSDQQGGSNPGEPGVTGSCAGKPVDCATGNQWESQSDLSVGGRGLGLQLMRTYNSQVAATATSAGRFGYGWSGSYSDHLVVNTANETATVVHD